jgi:hypothetical protein
MKTRTPRSTSSYRSYNGGRAIDLSEWFKFTCSLNSLVPAQPADDKPIEGGEDVTVTLKGFVLAVKFMRSGDHDIQVELGETPDWNGDHIVVEMSPGKEYCKARAALCKIVENDGCKEDECILKRPVRVKVKGYMMSGGAPAGTTDYCHVVSTRGLKDTTHDSRVRGVWRLQPVIKLKKIR